MERELIKKQNIYKTEIVIIDRVQDCKFYLKVPIRTNKGTGILIASSGLCFYCVWHIQSFFYYVRLSDEHVDIRT